MTIVSSESIEAEALSATICIVGAGAAGITLACELDGGPLSVLLLESGGFKSSTEAPEAYRGTAVAPHPAPSQFRRFAFGGTTSIWGGRCVPFDPIDFEARNHIPNSGWPISYDEVARYYPRAMSYCDAGAFEFTPAGSLRDPSPTIPGLERSADVLDRIERYSLPTHFGKRYRDRLAKSANVTVVLHARCVALKRAPGENRSEAAEIIDHNLRRKTVRARVFVLAIGGIETPRLLFASEPEGPGLGNRADRLGRFYACHFEAVCARVVPNGAAVKFAFETTKDGVYGRRKFQISADAQRRNRLLNCAFRLHFPDYSDASHGSSVMSAIYLAKSVLIPEYRGILAGNASPPAQPSRAAHLRNVACGLPDLGRFFLFDWLIGRLLARRKLPYTLVPNADGSFPLEFNSEQIPLESSRVTLTREADGSGMKRVHVDWRKCADDVDAACRAFVVMRDALARTSACRVEIDESGLRAGIESSIPIGGHHIGTARMAETPREGVVDANCAMFELQNVYIAGSAVFPTSSHANPTLTIVALALRLAAHLKQRG